MKAAAGIVENNQQPVRDFSFLDQLLTSQLYLPVQGEGFQAFITQSQVWQFRLTTAPHLAT
jgi:hypothetical protein